MPISNHRADFAQRPEPDPEFDCRAAITAIEVQLYAVESHIWLEKPKNVALQSAAYRALKETSRLRFQLARAGLVR